MVVVTLSCGQCGAALAFSGVRTEICPFCTSPNFVERHARAPQPDPQFVVAFAGDAAWARARLERWLGARLWFADAALRDARVEDIRGVYLPAYLYSAVAHTDYTAQIGERYTESETYETNDEQGIPLTKTRTVTRTEYRSLSGRHVDYVHDVVVSASAGLPQAELAKALPFDLRHLRRFTPAVVSGWIHEEFSQDADACQRLSRAEAIDQVGLRLREFLPGDSYNDLEWSTIVQWESFDPVLVPVFVLAVRYRADRPPLRIVINGQTGAIAGGAPFGWWKLAFALSVLAMVIAAIAWWVHR